MARYHTVVFDCDGTLLDTLEDLAAAGNAVCAQHGWPTYTPEQYKRKVGNGQLMLARRLMPPMTASNARAVAQVCDEFSAYYAEHKGDHTAPYPGILEALDRLRSAGVRLAVLTNKNDAPAQELVRGFFGERFGCVQGRTDAMPPKPAPAMMRAALGRLGVEPEVLASLGPRPATSAGAGVATTAAGAAGTGTDGVGISAVAQASASGETPAEAGADAGVGAPSEASPNPLAGFLMVGDSDVDIQVGRNVGMDTCGVLWGFRDRAELEHAGATHIAAAPADLVAIVLGTDGPAA